MSGLLEIYSSTGMNLTKWLSNYQQALSGVARGEWAQNLTLATDSNNELEPTLKTLGIIYDAAKDCFTFYKERPTISEAAWTKRSCLSACASIYDPLGLIAPYVIRAREFVQKLWQFDHGWDDLLPLERVKPWLAWIDELEHLDLIRVQRCLRPPTEEKQTGSSLHIFADASSVAYAACAYLVTTFASSAPTSHLVAARARLRKKGLTIPRCELAGAVLAVEMADKM